MALFYKGFVCGIATLLSSVQTMGQVYDLHPSDAGWSHAYGISDTGVAIGGWDTYEDTYTVPFSWTVAGGRIDYPAFGYAHAVSADGTSIVGYDVLTNKATWVKDGNLRFLENRTHLFGTDATGSMAVGSIVQADILRAAVWNSNLEMTLLEQPSGYLRSSAAKVSHDGSVIAGYAFNEGNQRVLVRWTSDGRVSSVLPGHYVGSFAMTADGSIIYFAKSQGREGATFSWSETEGLLNMGFDMAQVNDCTDDGEFLVGFQNRIDGAYGIIKEVGGGAYETWEWADMHGLDRPIHYGGIVTGISSVNGKISTVGYSYNWDDLGGWNAHMTIVPEPGSWIPFASGALILALCSLRGHKKRVRQGCM